MNASNPKSIGLGKPAKALRARIEEFEYRGYADILGLLLLN